MFKQIIIVLFILGLVFPINTVIAGDKNTPSSRLKGITNTYPKAEILYRNDNKNKNTWEVFIIKDTDGDLYLITMTKDGKISPSYNISLNKLTMKNQVTNPIIQVTDPITKEVIKNIICVKNRSGILVNGTLYFIGEESSYDENLLQPIRCLK